MEKIIVTVDLGHFKAYKVTQNPLESPRVQLIESYDSIEAHGRLGDRITDEAGRFGMAGGKGGAAKGYGEPHNIALETEKKLVKLIARDINAIIRKESCDRWFLAAERKINKQVLDNLDPDVRSKLEKNIAANLTKTDKSEIRGYFE